MTTKRDVSIHDEKVAGPEALTVSRVMANRETLMAWFERFNLYVESMEALGRTVIVNSDDDSNSLVVGSVDVGGDED